jgi:predicted dehydrogenase
MRELHAVVCGAGAAGVVHALTYLSAGVRIVGVHDPDPTRAAALADITGAEAHATAEELFACDAELASICSPPAAHVAQAIASGRPGRTVFVEKPIAASARELDRIATMDGCVPIVQWRAGRALRAVRAAIARGMLGPSPTVSADLAWSRDDAYFAAGRASPTTWGCGVLLSVGIHAIDALCWALARPVIAASGALGHRCGIAVETSAVAYFRFAGGALASVRATFDSGADATRLSFTGNGVTAVIEGSELDPTASAVAWSATDERVLGALRSLESGCSGGLAPPLVVPFLRDAIAALVDGARPGDRDTLPAARDVEDAHRAILDVYRTSA